MSGWKRTFDLVLGVPALCAAAPVIAGLALAVRATSPGSAYFLHERVGLGGRRFRVYKLRTMLRRESTSGPQVTAHGDRRITPLGRVLRKTKLDELPQLWNVVKGDMSFVGPRPEAPKYVERFRPEWREVLSVRPGITDLASLAFRNEEDLLGGAENAELAYVEAILPHKIPLALEGIRRASFVSDCTVIGRTLLAVLRPDQPEHPAVVAARRAIRALK